MALVRLLVVVLLIASVAAAATAYPVLLGAPTSAENTTTTTGSTTTAPPPPQDKGTLSANVDIGPIRRVCMANSTTTPGSSFSRMELVITSPTESNTTLPLEWMSTGCDAFASSVVPLAPGTYTLNLTNRTFVGCSSSLPRSFTVVNG